MSDIFPLLFAAHMLGDWVIQPTSRRWPRGPPYYNEFGERVDRDVDPRSGYSTDCY